MGPLLLKHLATSLIRRFDPSLSTSAASLYRCLWTVVAAAPRPMLLSAARAGPVPTPLLPVPSPPTLPNQCLHLLGIHPAAGMKTKSALKKRCKDCFFVRRRGRLFVFCKTNPRHKQRQG